MTLNRLLIIIGIVVLLVTAFVLWYWNYACTPAARAETIFTQLRGDSPPFHTWMLQHQFIRPGFSIPPSVADSSRFPAIDCASDALVKLGPDAFPSVVAATADRNSNVRWAAIRACGSFRKPAAIPALIACTHGPDNPQFYDCQSDLVDRRHHRLRHRRPPAPHAAPGRPAKLSKVPRRPGPRPAQRQTRRRRPRPPPRRPRPLCPPIRRLRPG